MRDKKIDAIVVQLAIIDRAFTDPKWKISEEQLENATLNVGPLKIKIPKHKLIDIILYIRKLLMKECPFEKPTGFFR